MFRKGVAILIAVYLFFTPVFSQGVFRNLTPAIHPNSVFEQISANGTETSRFLYALINTPDKQVMAMHLDADYWSPIPLPNDGKRLLSIAASYYVVFALEENAGENKLFKWEEEKWSQVSTGKLNGNITHLFSTGPQRMVGLGTFEKSGKPYYAAEYFDKKWNPLDFSKSAPAIAELFAQGDITTIAAEKPTGISVVVQSRTTGKCQAVGCDEKGEWTLIGQPLPGPSLGFVASPKSGLHILGTVEGSAENYLLFLKGNEWVPVDRSLAPFSNPTNLSADNTGKPIVSGPDKDGSQQVIATLDYGWAKLSSFPFPINTMVWAHGPRLYPVTADRKKLYTVARYESEVDNIVSEPLPITTYKEESELVAKFNSATITNIKGLMDWYFKDLDFLKTVDKLGYKRLGLAGKDLTKSVSQDAALEGYKGLALTRRYQSKLALLTDKPSSDTAMIRLFTSFIEAQFRMWKSVTDFIGALRTARFGETIIRLAQDEMRNAAIDIGAVVRSMEGELGHYYSAEETTGLMKKLRLYGVSVEKFK